MPATQIALTIQPGRVATTGFAQGLQPKGEFRDGANLLVSTETSPVTATLVMETGTGVARGTTTVNAVGGVWNFRNSGLGVVSAAGGVAHWHLTTPGLPAIDTASFTVYPVTVGHRGAAVLPRVTPNYTSTNTFGGGTTYTPANGAALRALLDGGTLVPGDVIVLTDGVCYNDATYMQHRFRPVAGATGSNPVWVVTSNTARLPAPGKRVQDAHLLATPHFRCQTANLPCVKILAGANGWRFVGIQADEGSGYGAPSQYGVVVVGPVWTNSYSSGATFQRGDVVDSGGQNYLSLQDSNIGHIPGSSPSYWRTMDVNDLPDGIIFDRCDFQGKSWANNVVEVLVTETRETAHLGCRYITQGGNGIEDKGLAAVTAAGPWLIDNCQITAGAINMLVGGAQPLFPTLPRDVTIRRTWFYKPKYMISSDPAWDGKARGVKNNFEMKCGEYWLVEDCLFENSYEGGTSQYYSINIKNSTGTGTGFGTWYPYAKTSNVTMRYCRFKSLNGIFVLGAKDAEGGNPGDAFEDVHDLSIYECYTEDKFGNLNGIAAMKEAHDFQLGDGLANLWLDNLTLVADLANQISRLMRVDDMIPGFVFRNSLVDWGSSDFGGIAGLNSYRQRGTEAFQGTDSAIDGIWMYDPSNKRSSAPSLYPTPPFQEFADIYVNRAGNDFHPVGALLGAGYGGVTPGADIDTILTRTQFAATGDWSGAQVADHLAVTTQPSDSPLSGQPHATQPAGLIQDLSNATVTSDASTVTATLVVESGSATPIGTLTTTVVGGAWSFAGKGLGATGIGAVCHWDISRPGLPTISTQLFSVADPIAALPLRYHHVIQ